ncbi:MAG: HD domain-containing protein [DPANN group archaeon]|nr:HD domain-containing protein [DPANN group archaeon]
MKIIKDAIHGDIYLTDFDLAILDTPEFQRLRHIKQLGLADLIYPSATHTRFQHSLGTFYITAKTAESLELDKDTIKELKVSALLHDIGHLPFSHTLEKTLNRSQFSDHVDISRDIILNKMSKILEENGVDPKNVVKNIEGKGKFGKIFSSGADVDKMDYLLRDSYFTGVAYGLCDLSRLLSTSILVDDIFAFKHKSLRTIESLVLSRFMMFSAVYDHPVKKGAEKMLMLAMDSMDKRSLNIKKLIEGDEIDFLSIMRQQDGITKDMINRIDNRNLFKRAGKITKKELKPEQLDKCFEIKNNLKTIRRIENEIAEALKIPKGYILIDILRKPKGIENIKIYKDNELVNLSEVSLFSKSLLNLGWQDWRVSFYCPNKYKEIVSNKAKDIFISFL